jgi:hypothetical protein
MERAALRSIVVALSNVDRSIEQFGVELTWRRAELMS